MTPDFFRDCLQKGDYEQLYQKTSNRFKKKVSNQEFHTILSTFFEKQPTLTLQSRFIHDQETEYSWIDESKTRGVVALFQDEGTISGMYVLPLTNKVEPNHAWTKNNYYLPFTDKWFTYWGGDNELVNYHYTSPHQRHAYDFIKHNGRKSHDGPATKNRSYLAFGKPVIASAPGRVVEAITHVPDNKPVGKMNEKQPLGNYVVIEHEHGEYSFTAHLQQFSVLVRVGESVKAGQKIGNCGNSGNSSEAHIHFQVSDGPDFQSSTSLRIQFQTAIAPIRGQFINSDQNPRT
ncbi:M23 family metallopeptidase [Geomicrobium sediminis]|uniref:Murein DD-endopeptidase MepM/ murein hydrolase activator NlpD n=1 Tax=Geomicrobium sediminis TaxID=1347788 RepID=A0ABS2PC67_9BACL|nr:M23 family metallopeptidase [Geomicrobium sediminis]MBM7633022.1 murein DD-endopeptidase MepM/ murein hydrolase activator NlpD [Geomicrobium sediminis]